VDIEVLSVAMNQSQIQQQASLSVMKMAMNSVKQDSVDLTKMLKQSIQPHLGSQIDIKL
jgi:hypothetical protein